MLYKNYSIEILQSAWIGKIIDGINYSFAPHKWYYDRREIVRSLKLQNHTYMALISEVSPVGRPVDCCSGYTRLIAINLAKFKRDLLYLNWQKYNKRESEIMKKNV
jgi:hypothetical protein